MNRFVLTGVVICLSINITAAADNAPALGGKAMDKEHLIQQIARVRSEMRPGGRYEFVNEEERGQVNESLSAIDTIVNQHATLSELSEKEKIELFNAQESANATLKQRDGERLVCENVQQIGSHQKRVACQTYAEQQRNIQKDRDMVRKAQTTPKSDNPATR